MDEMNAVANGRASELSNERLEAFMIANAEYTGLTLVVNNGITPRYVED